MQTVIQFFRGHIIEVIEKAFTEKQQNVVIVSGETENHLLVIDSPEYDFMWHRCTVKLSLSRLLHSLEGKITILWPDNKRNAIDFGGEGKSFGDALELLQNRIWDRIN